MVKVPTKKVRVVSVAAAHSSSEGVMRDVTMPVPPWELDQRGPIRDCMSPSREGSDSKSVGGCT